jgi:hypothetical protein
MFYRNERPKYFGFTPQEVEVDGHPALYFADGHLQIMSKEDFDEMIELAKRFYESKGVEEWIKKENAISSWASHPVMGTTLVDGKYVLPDPLVGRRAFRKNLQRNWGFNCSWCNKEVSSKVDTEYFRINESIIRAEYVSGRCCSEVCADNLWYDLIIEMILEKKLTDFFHTDKTIKA